MERDEERWGEVCRDGETWREMWTDGERFRDGERLREM